VVAVLATLALGPTRGHAGLADLFGTLCSFNNPTAALQDTDTDGIPDAWELAQAGDLESLAADRDADGDGLSDRLEYLAGTSPTNGGSRLAVTRLVPLPDGGLEVRWASVEGRRYDVERATNPWTGAVAVVAAGLAPTPPFNAFTDTVAAAGTPCFYRVRVLGAPEAVPCTNVFGTPYDGPSATHSQYDLDSTVSAMLGDSQFALLFNWATWMPTMTVDEFWSTLYGMADALLDNPRYATVAGVQTLFLSANGDVARVVALIADLRTELQTFTGVLIPPTLNPVQGGYTRAQVAAAADLLFGIVIAPAYSEAALADFLDKALGLDQGLASGGLRSAFTDLFGIAPASQVPGTNPSYRQLLGELVTGGSYSQAGFLASLPGAAALHVGLSPLRAEFATLYGIAIADQNPVANAAYRAFLFDTASPPEFALTPYRESLQAAASLYAALGSPNSPFAILFGVPGPSQNPAANSAYRALLFDLVGTPGYGQAAFLAGLDEAAGLHAALGGANADFALLFGVAPSGQDPAANPLYRQILFSLAGASGYERAQFLTALAQAASLHRALGGANLDVAATFHFAVETQDPASNPAYRTWLFDLVGDPDYEEAEFLAWLAVQPW
jgi:hypothetical protein